MSINEVLFMELRIFSEFIQKFNIKPYLANQMFEKYGIWKYIEECYDILHMNGDEYVLNDVVHILQRKGRSHAERWNAPVSWELHNG